MANAPKKEEKWKGAGRIAFLAHIGEIDALLTRGWPLRAVYRKYEANLQVGYVQFTRYVAEFARRGDLKPRGAVNGQTGKDKAAPQLTAAAPKAKVEAEKPRQEQRQRGFVFDPMAVDKKDLI